MKNTGVTPNTSPQIVNISCSDQSLPNSDYNSYSRPDSKDLDYTLLNKISELIPDDTDILLKHIVKEINGSARGLSDFVSLFIKNGKTIQAYNQLVYFQRKGCHFLKRVKF
jgi:hypothetical protein